MTTAAPSPTPIASSDLPAASWSAKLAAYASRGVPENDPRVNECRRALAYWRCRTVIERERDLLDPADAAILQGALTMRT